jgi:uncharacterized protein (TIGR03083 family)
VAVIRQFYGAGGVPLVVDAGPADTVGAWRTQRTRLRSWLDDLPDDRWAGPTRCRGWDTGLLVRHLSSAAQFLGYTLAEASGGTATTLLQGMDTRSTVAAAAEVLGDREPGEARAFLAGVDDGVDRALDRLGPRGLGATAEGPPGHMPAHLVVSHFLFDSWVHEYDLLLPRGERPPVDPVEAEVVVRYLAGLAPVLTGASVPLDLRLSAPELRIAVACDGPAVTVHVGGAPGRGSVVEGTVLDVVDRMSGRPGGPVEGDDEGLAVLDALADVFAT